MIVTLLTDFGVADYFAGAMKGAVLAVNPGAQVVDLTHEIPAHDVEAAAFTLLAAYDAFPAGTVHVAVVDPGVGSARRPVVVAGGGHLFVGPDNGVFSYVCERAEGSCVFHATESRFFRVAVSATFHGRDVFAPLAGALSRGVKPESLGPLITDYARLPFPTPRRLDATTLEGSVIHVDHFGNCITNLPPLPGTIEVGGRPVTRGRTYGEGLPGSPLALVGSAGLIELAVPGGRAADNLGIGVGAEVILQSKTGVHQ